MNKTILCLINLDNLGKNSILEILRLVIKTFAFPSSPMEHERY